MPCGMGSDIAGPTRETRVFSKAGARLSLDPAVPRTSSESVTIPSCPAKLIRPAGNGSNGAKSVIWLTPHRAPVHASALAPWCSIDFG